MVLCRIASVQILFVPAWLVRSILVLNQKLVMEYTSTSCASIAEIRVEFCINNFQLNTDDDVTPQDRNTGLLDALEASGTVKTAFVGHDHGKVIYVFFAKLGIASFTYFWIHVDLRDGRVHYI